ncbi:MAG: DNA polymerase I, partial [Candidatus Krumholzibacteria bacterium]|nr:DNA polymerase I [Candidatus Krumholzibacteria bacterium]
ILRPARGSVLQDEIAPDYLEKRFGLQPRQMVDLLALMGDSSDNIPGVKGIGEKIALELLHSYGSLDEILDRLDEVEPEHVRRKIKEGRESALFSRELVTLREVPLSFSLDDLTVREPDEERLTDLLLRFEFHQILRDLSLRATVRSKETQYSTVTENELENLARRLGSSRGLVFDVETTSLDPMKAEIVGISFCVEEGRAFYIPVSGGEIRDELFGRTDKHGSGSIHLDKVRQALTPVFTDKNIEKIGHNIKYDLLVLEAHGFSIEGISFDTMIASYCLDPERRSHSLDTLALEFCRHRMISYRELFAPNDRERDIHTVSTEKLADYSCEDADYTLRLKKVFEKGLKDFGLEKLFSEVEMPLCLVLKRMEQEGVALDGDKLVGLSSEVSEHLKRLTREIHEHAGEEFNINSGKQLQHILFEKLGLPAARRTKTGYSTDVEVLTELATKHGIAKLVLEHRKLTKMVSTYIDALPRLVNPSTGRIHTSFNQAVTATGRLSSSAPNLQNIPIRTGLGRKIRSAFIPREGNLLMDADYS